jgi:small-conductance mechanosensitive channel
VGVCTFLIERFHACLKCLGPLVGYYHSQIFLYQSLATSDRVQVGDRIEVSGSRSTIKPTNVHGIVQGIGWTETTIRGANDHIVSIPNRDLCQRRLHNLSRAQYSHVHQTLRFKYKEAHKLPALLKSIKDEIRLACPTVMADDESLPLNAHWINFQQDFLQVDVDAHFRISPAAVPECLDNRQRVLQAIHRAIKINQVEYYNEAAAATTSYGEIRSSMIASSSRPQPYAANSARMIINNGRTAGGY